MKLVGRSPRERAIKNAAVRLLLRMNMHELLASGPLLVTCVAQLGLRASGVRQRVVVDLPINTLL